ncbi:ABC transporter permease [Enterococcus sp. AZ103]|uniref:ABC transporter permease n=1 Tax=Enterococcus sp. AZ103 TaxID=2774628 RepID=UPI003F29E691
MEIKVTARTGTKIKLRTTISKQKYSLLAAASFIVVLALWQVLSTSGLVSQIFLPTPAAVVEVFITSLQDGSLATDTWISFSRIIQGFLLAIVIGVPIGILVGSFAKVEAFVLPLTEFFRYLPVPAFVPLIMVWVGIGENAKVAVILLGILFQLIPMVADNVKSVPSNLINAAYTLGAKSSTVIFKVIVPAMLPKLMESLRMIMGWAWTYLVVAELVAASSGLGYNILKAQRFLDTPSIFMGILVIGVLGLITDRLFGLLNKVLFRWVEE